MFLTGRTANRIVSVMIYFGGCLLLLKGGFALINYSVDSKLYNDFLVPWRIAADSYKAKAGDWSGFTGSNHLPYMNHLVKSMQRYDIYPPESNTGHKFIYSVKKTDIKSRNFSVLLLCLKQRIVIYGLPEKTFQRIDRFIDNHQDRASGNFTGKLSLKDQTCTGIWQL